MRYSEKENFNRVLRRDNPSHVCYPPPSRGGSYHGCWPSHLRPSPEATFWRDEWGVGWTDAAGEVFPTHPAVDSYDELDAVPQPDPFAPGRMDPVEKALVETDREQYFFGVGHPYFLYEKAINILGPEEFAVSMLAEPDKAHELLDRIMVFEMGIAEQYVRYRPDHLNLSDDYGHQDRLAMSPATWRTFFKPRLARIIGFYRERLGPELAISVHSCGNVMDILEDLCEVGVDILHPIQSTANDLRRARAITTGRLTLAGGIDGQRVLPLGTPEQVREEVFTKMHLLWENGGYLPMAEKNLGVSQENMQAMEQAIRDWSREHVER